MNLTGPEREKLKNALLDAYPNYAKLEQLVGYGLSKNLETIARGSDLEEIIFELIRTVEAERLTKQLIIAAIERNTHNEMLQIFYQEYLQRQAQEVSVEDDQDKPTPSKTTNPSPNQVSGEAQTIPDSVPNLSSSPEEYRVQARQCIIGARKCVENAYILFKGRGEIGPVQRNKATTLLSTTNEHLQHLRTMLNTTPLFRSMTTPYPFFISIDQLDEQVQDLISSIGNLPTNKRLTFLQKTRQQIKDKFEDLMRMLKDLEFLIPD